MLGEKILKLRKKQGLSQEQLGEMVGVTRQTISNWELGETAPNPEQLKLLSKALDASIDEMLDNEVRGELINKVSNTEKLAGLIIKILKVLGILFILYALFVCVCLVCMYLSTFNNRNVNVESSATTICSIDKNKYEIEFGTNGYFKCDNCPDKMRKDIKELTDFDNMGESIQDIEEYFKNNNGTCE